MYIYWKGQWEKKFKKKDDEEKEKKKSSKEKERSRRFFINRPETELEPSFENSESYESWEEGLEDRAKKLVQNQKYNYLALKMLSSEINTENSNQAFCSKNWVYWDSIIKKYKLKLLPTYKTSWAI